jgi:ABC-type transporter Mla subunit MlaD
MRRDKVKPYARKHKRQNKAWIPLAVMLGGVLLIALAFWGLNARPTPRANVEVTGAPALKTDKEKVDLGDVKLGQVVEVSFQLTNVGDQTLRFTKPPYVEVVEGC